ncbi:hypothetical protein BN7874_115 [Phage NCTB]|jgi:hypothetical protein|nr:hypothetical protein BN7874_115 [Phage NCTB]
MTTDNTPWYKKYWLALLAGLGLILTGVAIALTGGKAGRRVGELEKGIRDIDDEQTKQALADQQQAIKKLEEEKEMLHNKRILAEKKLEEQPKYDESKSDLENLEAFKGKQW